MATGDAIAVIGDGAISAGMAYEAMNHAGDQGHRLFVILNDNEMTIAPPVGAMSKYLSGLNRLDAVRRGWPKGWRRRCRGRFAKVRGARGRW